MKELSFNVYELSDHTKKITYIASLSTSINQYYVERLCDESVTITKIKRIYI